MTATTAMTREHYSALARITLERRALQGVGGWDQHGARGVA